MSSNHDERQQSEASATCVASPPLNDLLSGVSSQEGFSSMLLGRCKSCGDVESRVVFGDESDVFDMADMAQQLEKNGRIVDQEYPPSFTGWKWCECAELSQAT